jgi:hypothetical protein
MSLRWHPPVTPSAREQAILARCKARKLYVFLRTHRHELFDDAFQDELASMYGRQAPGGTDAVPPALLAMVTILQAAFHVGDADAVEQADNDRRWKMVLDSLDEEDAPFSQGTLYNFRERLIAHDMDRRLLDRTVELAKTLGGFGHRNLRAAFDASPLFGAGRVEDTFNLIGHAAREMVRTASQRLALPVEEVAARAGIPVLNASSIKAGLDVDWDDPRARTVALTQLVEQVERLARWLSAELADSLNEPPLKEQLATMERLIAQDTEPDPDDGAKRRVRAGVARERQISVRDPEMRHGRKSKSSRIDGYKRHLAVDLDHRLILGAAITPANRPEAEAMPELLRSLPTTDEQTLTELLIDRGYLSAQEVDELRRRGVAVRCKPYPLRNGSRFTKADFLVDLAAGTATCPNGITTDIHSGRVAHFSSAACSTCPLRASCTTTRPGTGRSLAIHEHELLHQELRAARRDPVARRTLRERTHVEHRLSHLGRSQGPRARYIGVRKNLFDIRRHAAVVNLHTAARLAVAA